MKEFSKRNSVFASSPRVFGLRANAGWFLLVALAVALGLMLFSDSKAGKVFFLTLKNEPAGANRGDHFAGGSRGDEALTSSIANRKSKIENAPGDDRHLYDSSPTDGSVLISKAGSGNDAGEDLWLRDATGQERFIAPEVIGAKFSPDGNKIAYSTRGNEVFIETLRGKRLAQIPRASDPLWRTDSMTLSFSAMLSLDHPELQHRATYDLHSDQIAESKNGN